LAQTDNEDISGLRHLSPILEVSVTDRSADSLLTDGARPFSDVQPAAKQNFLREPA
jgi:hypothetical protein